MANNKYVHILPRNNGVCLYLTQSPGEYTSPSALYRLVVELFRLCGTTENTISYNSYVAREKIVQELFPKCRT